MSILQNRRHAKCSSTSWHSLRSARMDQLRDGRFAVMGLELLVQVGERHRHKHVHATQQVVRGDPIFEPELVEQAGLIPPLPPHHRPALQCR
jgi:hypothetical protein